MTAQMTRNFENKIVQIYPGDTYKKWGRVIDINSEGVTFEITKSTCDDYVVGDIYFISYSARLTFKLAANQ
jgi:hypothetical protein